jgi:hypothetical protein
MNSGIHLMLQQSSGIQEQHHMPARRGCAFSQIIKYFPCHFSLWVIFTADGSISQLKDN